MSQVVFDYFDEDDPDLQKIMSDIASLDNKPAFLCFMRELFRKGIPKIEEVGKKELYGNQAKYCAPVILDMICRYDAIHCAVAFFEGKTGFIADLNVPFKDGIYPLHLAANRLSYEMVALLLYHGAKTDVRTIEGRTRGDLLPLNVSLETISHHRYLIDWTPEQSIFKLIIVLCLPQMKLPLEVNRLLALRTTEVDKIFSHYATERELIEMATLLMVAREKIMPLSMFESKDGPNLDGSMSIRKSIIEEFVSLTDDKIKLVGSEKNGKLVQSGEDTEAAMMQGLLLLKVFEKAGAAVEKYRQSVQSEMPKEKVVHDIKALLERAGFVLKDKDVDLSDIDCESESIKVAAKALEKTTKFGPHLKDLYMPFNSLSGSIYKNKSSFPYRMGRWWAILEFLHYGYRVLLPSHEFLFPPMNKKKSNCIAGTICYKVFSEPEVKRASAAYFLSTNQLASLSLAIRKGITRI